jgi:hypothetical protein
VPGPSAERRLAALQAVVSALAHPARRQILLTIKLRGAGLVAHRRRGRTRVYRLRAARLAILREWLGWFTRS